MLRRRKLSVQALSVLQAFVSRPHDWRYGYDLTKETGLRSGTLYPLLMRLTDDGVMESEWQAPARDGRPPRHAYRLTPTGVAMARDALKAARSPRSGMGLSSA